METQDLLVLREHYNRQRIMLCFNGPISRSLIEEIGNALRNYLAAEQAQPSAAMDVFAVYIEMTQNIRHYALQQGYGEQDASATVAIARDEQGHYQVSAGNLVERADGERLLQIVEGLGDWTRSSSRPPTRNNCASRARRAAPAAPALACWTSPASPACRWWPRSRRRPMAAPSSACAR